MAESVGRRVVPSFSCFEVVLWAFFSVSPFLMVGGYLLYHYRGPSPPVYEVPQSEHKVDSFDERPPKVVYVREPAGPSLGVDEDANRWNDFQAKLARLEYGMDVNEVSRVLGRSKKLLISGKTQAGERKTYEWTLLDEYRVTCDFVNGRLSEFKDSSPS